MLWVAKGLGLGGAERLLALTAARLDARRFDVHVAYVLRHKDAFAEELRGHGVSVHDLQAARTTDPRWVAGLARLLRHGGFDLVHTHSPVPATAARLLAPRSLPLVHTEHNVWERYRWPTFAANAVTYRRNAAVVAVSDGVAESVCPRWWTPGPLPPVEVLLHGVNPQATPHGAVARTHARGLLGLDEDTPVIGTVANFTPKKDHAGIVTALDRLRDRFPSVVMVLIGSGPLEAELREQVGRLGLGDHVRFLGSRADVAELLPALDVFVLGSRYEGLPIAMLEAMAAGVACVATRVGGVPEVITDGVDGRLVAPGAPAELADAIGELLADAVGRAGLAEAGRQRVRDGFSIDRAVRRTEELYAEVLASKGGR